MTSSTVAATTLSSSGLATLQSTKITNLTPNSFVVTDASNNLISSTFVPQKSIFMSISQCRKMAKAHTTQSSSVFFGNTILRYVTAAVLDKFSCEFTIDAGTYTLSVMGGLVANSGIWDFQIDGAGPVLSVDMYSAATALAYVNPGTFVIPAAGSYTLTMQTNSKNVSSTGFYGYFYGFSLWNGTALV